MGAIDCLHQAIPFLEMEDLLSRIRKLIHDDTLVPLQLPNYSATIGFRGTLCHTIPEKEYPCVGDFYAYCS